MIDLNHGSGFQYARPDRPPGVAIAVNAVIDAALVERNRAQPPRRYVGTSGVGRECPRQIQYDYLGVPKDEGRDFEPNTLRIFEAGHRAEDIVAAWLRAAKFDLRTARSDGQQFGFSALNGRFRGHIDGCLVSGPVAMKFPALWENKALGAASWKEVVKRGVVVARPVYAAQIALYQAYLDLPYPALFTALNRDTLELHCELVTFDAALAQRASDRAVQVVRASAAEELLPRAAADRTSAICRGGRSAGEWHPPCAWQDRCWKANEMRFLTIDLNRASNDLRYFCAQAHEN
ncbi:MAG: hypothetical protein IT518_28585 [Burkholderiales bacterium]|nr:hypothetical protein [Burkholderiales bacterium]